MADCRTRAAASGAASAGTSMPYLRNASANSSSDPRWNLRPSSRLPPPAGVLRGPQADRLQLGRHVRRRPSPAAASGGRESLPNRPSRPSARSRGRPRLGPTTSLLVRGRFRQRRLHVARHRRPLQIPPRRPAAADQHQDQQGRRQPHRRPAAASAPRPPAPPLPSVPVPHAAAVPPPNAGRPSRTPPLRRRPRAVPPPSPPGSARPGESVPRSAPQSSSRAKASSRSPRRAFFKAASLAPVNGGLPVSISQRIAPSPKRRRVGRRPPHRRGPAPARCRPASQVRCPHASPCRPSPNPPHRPVGLNDRHRLRRSGYTLAGPEPPGVSTFASPQSITCTSP